MECAGAEGMRPHMTIGSWQVTPDEMQQAIAKAQTLQGRIPSRVMALQPVVREQQNGGLSFNFVPAADAPGPAIPLADYHRMVHEQLGFKFEPYRPIDLPGQWRPHVTMFSGNAEARAQTEKAIELAKQVKQVRIASLRAGGLRPAQDALRDQVRAGWRVGFSPKESGAFRPLAVPLQFRLGQLFLWNQLVVPLLDLDDPLRTVDVELEEGDHVVIHELRADGAADEARELSLRTGPHPVRSGQRRSRRFRP